MIIVGFVTYSIVISEATLARSRTKFFKEFGKRLKYYVERDQIVRTQEVGRLLPGYVRNALILS